LPQQSNVGKRNRQSLWASIVGTTAITALGTFLLWHSPVGEFLDLRIARSFDFYMRDLLGKTPSLDPKLKVYAYDNNIMDKLQSSSFSLSQWAMILKSFADQQPRSIVIDKVFSITDQAESDLGETLRILNSISVPIRTGAVVAFGKSPPGAKVLAREPLDLSNPFFNFSHVSHDERPVIFDGGEDPKPYGPHRLLKHAFGNGGHILHEGMGTVAALVKITEDLAIPHLGLLVPGNFEAKQGDVYVNGKPVHIDSTGRININFINPEVLRLGTKSLYEPFVRARNGRPNKQINSDDTILILPDMFTGHTDNTMTPYGLRPGGIVIASLVNSALTGEWLKKVTHTEIYIILAALGGAFLGLSMSTFWFFFALFAIGGSMLGGDIILFSFAGLITPWLPVTFGFMASGIFAFAIKARANEQQSRILSMSLAGLLPEQRLRALIENPSAVNLEFNEQNISIMFIDIVGFSAIPKIINPQAIFEELRNQLGSISDTIKEHGGIVDKSLGDGMMCYFGYRFNNEEPVTDHARRAVDCAVQIQRNSMEGILKIAQDQKIAENDRESPEAEKTQKFKRPVFPLRIGINTAPAFVGNLGTNQRIDFTVIGAGVNLAKRLEAGCDLFTILFSKETYEAMGTTYLDSRGITPRFIEVKHAIELQAVFEFDPFFADQSKRDAGFTAYRNYLPLDRVNERFKVAPHEICVTYEGKKTLLYDFSERGIAVVLDRFLTKGNQMELTLDDMAPDVREKLEKIGISKLKGEVRWTTKIVDDYIHGLLLTNISDGQLAEMAIHFKSVIFADYYTTRKTAKIDSITKARKPA
jgi:class 3 adenylate cyclase